MNSMREADWLNLEYLKKGTPTQQAAFAVLQDAHLFELLASFCPVLAGTIPLDVDLPGSDLDILCEVREFAPFATRIRGAFGHLPDFYQNTKALNGVASHITRFTWTLTPNGVSFPIEIVGQAVPTGEQRAFRHLVAEARLLAWDGEAARNTIRALKRAGMKTEPAFAHYFGLGGEPFAAVLAVADWEEETFAERLPGMRKGAEG